MNEERRIRYRVPVLASIVPLLPLLIYGVFLRFWIGLAAVGVFVAVVSALGRGLELTEHDAVVRDVRPAQVAWSSVTSVRSGGWRGGIVLGTAAWREIWSPAPCSWWGGGASAERVAEVERWWVEHRGPAWTPAPAVAPVPVTNKPPVRYRTSSLAAPVAVLGLLVAAANGAALRWPFGRFTLLAVEFTEPSVDDGGWSLVAAMAAGAVLGTWGAVKARRVLTRGAPPQSAANTVPGDGARPLLVVAAAGGMTAITQWLGMAPTIGSLSIVVVGVAATVSGASMTVAARRFERRTGRLLLSTNPVSRGLGLETGPRCR